jgi:hypothetical protein
LNALANKVAAPFTCVVGRAVPSAPHAHEHCSRLASEIRRAGDSAPYLRSAFRFVVLLLSLLLTINARADIRFDVFLGHDQIVPEASWFPVTFEVFNDGAPCMGLVEVTPGSYDSSHTRVMAVELPTGTTKRFTIPAFSSGRYIGGWNARLLDEKGRVRAEQINVRVRQTNPWQLPMAAAVSRTMPALPKVRPNQPEMQPIVARFQPAVFPDNPITLEGLDTIYLQAERALDLKVNQVNALLSWLNAGGHLIVGVEQILHINGNEWLKNLLPCEFTAMGTEASHTELQEFVVSNRRRDGDSYGFRDSGGTSDTSSKQRRRRVDVGDISNPYAKLRVDSKFESQPLQVATGTLRDGHVLVGSPSKPLVITAQRGRGQLTVLTFSPELEPFLSWESRPHFWAKMMDMPPQLLATEQGYQYGGHSIDGVFGAMIDSKQVRKLPIGWLLVLLVGYLVVIGPLDRYWLNKINRQMLTWITFPIYVALFSGLIYLIGYKLRAGESEWNELHVVDVMPAGDMAGLRGRTYASIYSPVNARYRLAGDQSFSALRGEFMSYGGQNAGRATIEQRGNNFDAEISVPVWTSQLYVSDWWRQSPSPLKVSVKENGSSYDVTIENNLDRKVSRCRMVIDNVVLDVGELEPKQTRSLTLAKGGETLSGFVQRYGASFQSAISQRQQAFGHNTPQIFDIPHATMAASFVDQLRPGSQDYGYNHFIAPAGLDLSPLAERGHAILLAWVDDFSPIKPMNQFSPRRSHKDTLLRVATAVRN